MLMRAYIIGMLQENSVNNICHLHVKCFFIVTSSNST